MSLPLFYKILMNQSITLFNFNKNVLPVVEKISFKHFKSPRKLLSLFKVPFSLRLLMALPYLKPISQRLLNLSEFPYVIPVRIKHIDFNKISEGFTILLSWGMLWTKFQQNVIFSWHVHKFTKWSLCFVNLFTLALFFLCSLLFCFYRLKDHPELDIVFTNSHLDLLRFSLIFHIWIPKRLSKSYYIFKLRTFFKWLILRNVFLKPFLSLFVD